jgi:predicted Rossmann fold flavoprotein
VPPLPLLILGGGAAGFLAAITAAEAQPARKIILLEKQRQPLAKVRISGGGRCNVTHACFDVAELVRAYPRGSRELRGPFTRFGPRETVAWFAGRGVPLKTEADGRMFPTTDLSETIVECLLKTARSAGVELRTQVEVRRIERRATGFELTLRDGGQLTGERLVLATGSNKQGYAWAQALGHTLIPPVPSLFTFQIDDPRLHDLSGVSLGDAHLGLAGTKLEARGPLLITHWGLSGPAALKLSAWAARELYEQNYHAELLINYLPNFTSHKLQLKLLDLKVAHARRVVTAHSPLGLPQRLWEKLTMAAGMVDGQRWADVTKGQLNALSLEVTQGRYAITGKGVFKEEFVTCGGVSLREVDFKTMESRLCPGLYLAGEILDIDALTGGYNFQSAWTTGWLAGQALSGL